MDAAELTARAALPAEMFTTRRGERTERGYRVVDGVAVISAMGGLVHRTRLAADSSLLIGYNDLAADMEDALGQSDVHAIALVMDSPGGEVAGALVGRPHLRRPWPQADGGRGRWHGRQRCLPGCQCGG